MERDKYTSATVPLTNSPEEEKRQKGHTICTDPSLLQSFIKARGLKNSLSNSFSKCIRKNVDINNHKN